MASHPTSATSLYDRNHSFMEGDIARYVPPASASPNGSKYKFPRYRFPGFQHLEDLGSHYVVILPGAQPFKAADHTIRILNYQCLIISTNPFDPQASIKDTSLRHNIAGHGPKNRIRRSYPFYALFTETTPVEGQWDWQANSAVTLNVIEIPSELLSVLRPRGEGSRCRLISISRDDVSWYLTEFGMDEPKNWNTPRSSLPSLTTTESGRSSLSYYRSLCIATSQFPSHTVASMLPNTPEASPAHVTELQHTVHSTTATTGLFQSSLRISDPPCSTTTAGSVGSWDSSSDTTLAEEPEDIEHRHPPFRSTSPDRRCELTRLVARRWPKQSWTHPPLRVDFITTGNAYLHAIEELRVSHCPFDRFLRVFGERM